MPSLDQKNGFSNENNSLLPEQIKLKKQLEEKVFYTKNSVAANQRSAFLKVLHGHWQLVKKGVLILFVLQVVVYGLALVSSLRWLALTVIDPLLLVADFFYIGWILVRLKLKYQRTLWQSEITLLVLGISLGALVSGFKVIWIRQPWTLVNLLVEPFFMGGLAVLSGFIMWWFIKLK